MDDAEAGRYWDANAEAWTKLSRAGYDVYRDLVNTPAFFELLGDVDGLRGLDVGCGEGHNTRLLARAGARVTAIDISETFLRHARAAEADQPLGIDYQLASGQSLPFDDASFDFVTAFMSLMDMPQPGRAVAEIARVLRPGGLFQFSITHPCFQTPRWEWVRDDAGRRIGVICGDYFGPTGDGGAADGRIDEWTFGAAPPEARDGLAPFRVPRFDRTLSWWINTLVDAGFAIERIGEPCADEATAADHPAVADTRIVAYFLHVRCRKESR